MKLAIIVAQSSNRVIGRGNDLPWHLPEDLRYFKQVTLGKPIIMGRNTFESIGKPLSGRTNIVISRQADYQPAGVERVASLEEAIALGKQLATEAQQDELMIIGGAQIYAQSLDLADCLYLTQVQAEIEGDAYFPELDKQQWQEVSRIDFAATADNPYPYSFLVLDRIK